MSERCPALDDFESALSSATAFRKAMRRLRRSMRLCKRCASQNDCPIRRQFNAAIDQAILEIGEEWGLCLSA